MDVTPLVPAGRQLIERYGLAGFQVSGTIHNGPVLVFPDRTIAWEGASLPITAESLAPIIDKGGVEILLLGLGNRMVPLSTALRRAMRNAGIGIDPMDTGAACRTYNVLVGEDRRVAAALLLPT